MISPRRIFLGVLAAICVASSTNVRTASAVEFDWIRQFGSTKYENARAGIDRLGNVLVAGYTTGDLAGNVGGTSDAFVTKLNPLGEIVWTRQLGTDVSDWFATATGDDLGNVYAGGETYGDFAATNSGGADAIVAKFDALGNTLWTRQFGTSDSDEVTSSAIDGLGGVYFGGQIAYEIGNGAGKAMLAKYDPQGEQLWVRQLGPDGFLSETRGVATDESGNVYIVGQTAGGRLDPFIAKYDGSGNQLWLREYETSASDKYENLTIDVLGNLYAVGYTIQTSGVLLDAAITKYDSDGNLLWTRTFGTELTDRAEGVAADAFGNAYVVGHTFGDLGGPSAGGRDAYIAKYSADGEQLWIQQFGTSAHESADNPEIVTDNLGHFYVVGGTEGALGESNFGSQDVFVLKFSEVAVPEPVMSVLIAEAVTLFGVRYRRRPHSTVPTS